MTDDQQDKGIEKASRSGRRLHDVKQVPYAMRQEAQARWGVNVEFSASRENGRYTGPVFAGDEYVAQRVGEKSVVFHRRAQVDFTGNENLQKRVGSGRLNDTTLQIRYEGSVGRAFFHDPQRGVIEEMFGRIRSTAADVLGEESEDFAQFTGHLEQVKGRMVERHRDAKNRQFEQRTGGRIPGGERREALSIDR